MRPVLSGAGRVTQFSASVDPAGPFHKVTSCYEQTEPSSGPGRVVTLELGSVSKEQKDWHIYLGNIGHHVIIGKGATDASRKVLEFVRDVRSTGSAEMGEARRVDE